MGDVRATRSPSDGELLPVVGRRLAPIVSLLRTYAEQDETILLSGATGVGKSRLARFCHAWSPRAARPFETLNLLTVPEELQLAELFGWQRGSFTGAVTNGVGAITRARGGTLFIDEIDKLSLRAQGAMLQLLEERTYRSIGDTGWQRADVRFVVGTNARLRELVDRGLFRADLFFRIHVLPIAVPALSERRDEIPGWAAHFAARRHAESAGAGRARLADAAIELLVPREWPGNLRQLDNVVRRAYAIATLDRACGADLVIDARHVGRAVAAEEPAPTSTLLSQLHLAAEAFVREASARDRSRRPPLGLDLADAFRGLVLLRAVDEIGTREEAFRVLGQEHLIRNRNHHKVFRREVERAEALARALAGHADPRKIGDEA